MVREVIRHSIFDLQVCVPKTDSDADVTRWVNRHSPSGTQNGWSIMKNGDKYLDGAPERVPCADAPEHQVHIRFEC